MKPPRELLEGTDLVAYIVVPESCTFTGRLNLLVDGERLGRVACLAICRPHDDPGLLLLHCDATWELLGVQAWNAPGVSKIVIVEEMIEQVELYYEGLTGHWSLRSPQRWPSFYRSGSVCRLPIRSCSRTRSATRGRAGFNGSRTRLYSLARSSGRNYLLVDDFIGQGGTLANLIGYVEGAGGHAIGATVLTGKPYSAKLAPDDSLIHALRDEHGRDLENWWQEKFEFGFDCLTRSEARYLEKSPDAQAIRDRLIAAGLDGSSGASSSGAEPGSAKRR